MQSIQRAIKRGNAVVYYDRLICGYNVAWKRGRTKPSWKNAVKNKVSE